MIIKAKDRDAVLCKIRLRACTCFVQVCKYFWPCYHYYHFPFFSLERIGPFPLSLLLVLSFASVATSFQVLSPKLSFYCPTPHLVQPHCCIFIWFNNNMPGHCSQIFFFLNFLVSISPTTFLPWSSHQLEEEKTALIVVFMFTMAPRLVK